MMRKNLTAFFRTKPEGRTTSLGGCKWGVYAFFDFANEPIYVGQTREGLSVRVNRHLTNQRTDAVAMRILDPAEVAEVRVWPLWHLHDQWVAFSKAEKAAHQSEFMAELNNFEHAAYAAAVRGSKFAAILNEKIPPLVGDEPDLPEAFSGELYDGEQLKVLGNADVRIARRAEAVSRLADVARERGGVSAGLRRAIVIQAVRLTYLSAVRLAEAEDRDEPDPSVISSEALFGLMLPGSPGDEDEVEVEANDDSQADPVDFVHADGLDNGFLVDLEEPAE